MKTALVTFGYRRPEIHKLTLAAINRCRNIEKVDRFCYLDGDGYELPELKDFRVIKRGNRFGLNKNILSGIKELFEKEKYDRVIVVEDDIYVSADFIDFILAAYEYKNEHCFSVTGFHPSKSFAPYTKQEYKENEITIVDGYSPWGVMYDTADYALIAPYIRDEYFENQMSFFTQFVLPMAPYFKHASPLQDGTINTIRFAHQYRHVAPFFSRVQNIGYYGENQLHAYKQDGLTVADMIMQSDNATETFHEDYQWDELKLVKFVGEW
jgi:hypothetical protein